MSETSRNSRDSWPCDWGYLPSTSTCIVSRNGNKGELAPHMSFYSWYMHRLRASIKGVTLRSRITFGGCFTAGWSASWRPASRPSKRPSRHHSLGQHHVDDFLRAKQKTPAKFSGNAKFSRRILKTKGR